MKFTEMKLADYILKGLGQQGIETATEIQELTMPLIKSGADIIGLSQTGSGKTYAFAVPVLERVDTELNAVQFLVVCPTRELAAQVAEDFRKLTSLTSKISVAPIFGGSSMDRQIQTLKRGVKIIIGTPGRLMDHLRRKTLKLDSLKMVILDEADEMLNMGFKEDIETILKTTPAARQTVMFSATMPPEIQRITKQYMREPVLIKSKNQDSAPKLIKQYFVNCNKTEKTEVLEKIYEKFNPWISIVFCNTIKMTETLTMGLKQKGLPAVCLHGDMRQNERRRTMENFKKENGGGILVATDVAARGIDIKNVDIVVNYDFPNNEDYYVHRIGRTGRAGKDGVAFTIINTKDQAKDLANLIARTGGKAEEYAELSTTQWSGRESGRSEQRKEFRKRPGSGKPQQNRGFDRTKSKQENKRFDNRKTNDTNSKDNFKRVIGKPNGKDVEVFEIGSDAPRFCKPNYNRNTGNRFANNRTNQKNRNSTAAQKEGRNFRSESRASRPGGRQSNRMQAKRNPR